VRALFGRGFEQRGRPAQWLAGAAAIGQGQQDEVVVEGDVGDAQRSKCISYAVQDTRAASLPGNFKTPERF